MCLYLSALEEALLVTVGDVQRERQHPRSILHALNEVVQSSPAGTLRSETVNVSVTKTGVKVMVSRYHFWGRSGTGSLFTYKLRLQFVQAERREVQGAGLSQPGQLLLAVLGLLHGLHLATVVSSV